MSTKLKVLASMSSGMVDPDDLAAIADAARAEPVETLALPVAPGLVLELVRQACLAARRSRGTTYTHSGTTREPLADSTAGRVPIPAPARMHRRQRHL